MSGSPRSWAAASAGKAALHVGHRKGWGRGGGAREGEALCPRGGGSGGVRCGPRGRDRTDTGGAWASHRFLSRPEGPRRKGTRFGPERKPVMGYW